MQVLPRVVTTCMAHTPKGWYNLGLAKGDRFVYEQSLIKRFLRMLQYMLENEYET